MKPLMKPRRPLRSCLWLGLIAIFAFILYGCATEDDPIIETEWVSISASESKARVEADQAQSVLAYANKVQLMKLHYIQFLSNDFRGDVLSGPGAQSDPTRMYELLDEILTDRAKYEAALAEMDRQNVFDAPTTRGIGMSIYELCNALSGSANRAMTDIRTTMERGKFWSNAQVQEKLFKTLPPAFRDGETDAKEWFKRLNNNDPILINKAPQIQDLWVKQGMGESHAGEGVGAYYNAAQDANTENTAARAHEVGKAATVAGLNVAIDAYDAASGGWVGAMKEFEESAQVFKNLKAKYGAGKLSAADIRNALKYVSVKELKNALPDEIEGILSEAEFSEIKDYLESTILSDDEDGSAAATVGKKRASIPASSRSDGRYVVVHNPNTGKMIFVNPNNDRTATITIEEGQYVVTYVDKDGEIVHVAHTTQLGNQMEEFVLSPKSLTPTVVVRPTELSLDSDFAHKTIAVMSNCRYVNAHTSAKWLSLSLDADGYLFITADKNEGEEARTATITVKGSNDGQNTDAKATITVKQAAFEDLEQLLIRVGTWVGSEGDDSFAVTFRADHSGSSIDYDAEDGETVNSTFTWQIRNGRLYFTSVDGQTLDQMKQHLNELLAVGELPDPTAEMGRQMSISLLKATIAALEAGAALSYKDGVLTVQTTEDKIELRPQNP